MKIVPVVDAKARLSSYLDQCERESIVITKNGRPKALLIPAPEDEDELERLLLAYSPRFWKLLEEAAQRIRKSGGIPHDEFWARVERQATATPSGRARKKRKSPIAPKRRAR